MIKIVRLASQVNPAPRLSEQEALLATALTSLAVAADALDKLQSRPGTDATARRLAESWSAWYHARTCWGVMGALESELSGGEVRGVVRRRLARRGVRV